jgi:hypothetical protein
VSRQLAILLSLTAVPAAADNKKPDPKADAAALKGTWEVVRSQFNGEERTRRSGSIPSTRRS